MMGLFAVEVAAVGMLLAQCQSAVLKTVAAVGAAKMGRPSKWATVDAADGAGAAGQCRLPPSSQASLSPSSPKSSAGASTAATATGSLI